jgi:flagellar biogenesis protein FliO
MRLYAMVLVMLLGCSGWSQADDLPPGALGTRGGTPLRTITPSGSQYAWLQMTLALLLVAAGLRYGLPRLIGWAGKAGIGSRLDGEIRLLESRAVPGGSLLMVKARHRLLLIGCTPQGMQLLADLTENQREQVGVSEPSAFEQVLHRATPRGTPSLAASRRGQGEANGEPPQGERAGASPLFPDWQQEIALALKAHCREARARLARVAQQQEG